jgi:hypothetical protein
MGFNGRRDLGRMSWYVKSAHAVVNAPVANDFTELHADGWGADGCSELSLPASRNDMIAASIGSYPLNASAGFSRPSSTFTT